jgi:Flp pilus assembly protein TadD
MDLPQMCSKPVRLATALSAILVLGCAATPAFALFGKAKPTPEAAKPAQARQPAAAPAPVEVRRATAEQRAAADRADPLTQATFWLRETQANPTDVLASIKLSKAMRALGRNEEAVQAAEAAVVIAPDNIDALLENARAKIGVNQGFYAIATLERAQRIAPRDWRPLSLKGVALEQSERPEEARQAYEQALALSPDNAAVLSNMALLLAGRGDIAQAEVLLRKAVTRPEVSVQEQMNLALVLGLRGKVTEAEQIMRRTLPPEQANANLAYLRSAAAPGPVGAVGRSWGALEGAQR